MDNGINKKNTKLISHDKILESINEVGRKYEQNKQILKNIKEIFPQTYICNLDGKVIM